MIPQSEIGKSSNPQPASREPPPTSQKPHKQRRILTDEQNALLLVTWLQEAIDFMLDHEYVRLDDFLDETLGITPTSAEPIPPQNDQPPPRHPNTSLTWECRLCHKEGAQRVMVNNGTCFFWYHETCLPTPIPPSDPWTCPIDSSEISVIMSFGIRDGDLVMSRSAIPRV